jgi:hypothetical protein
MAWTDADAALVLSLIRRCRDFAAEVGDRPGEPLRLVADAAPAAVDPPSVVDPPAEAAPGVEDPATAVMDVLVDAEIRSSRRSGR